MSDTGDDYRAMDAHKKSLRSRYGIECPLCRTLRPKTNATILMPRQRCRVDGYVDKRPYLTDEQRSAA